MSHSSKFSATSKLTDEFSLAASIPLSGLRGNVVKPPLVEIPHIWNGKLRNTVPIWVRHITLDRGWDIFTLDVDFSKPSTQWFKHYPTSELQLNYRQFWDPTGMLNWPTPPPPGRRIIWQAFDPIPVGEPEAIPYDSPDFLDQSRPVKHRLRLCVSLIDYLPLIQEPYDNSPGYMDKASEEQTKSISVHELEVPDGYEADLRTNILFCPDLEERSGTVVSTMTTGNIWVLRYGHS